MVVAAIHQPNYLPWLGYFRKILESDVFVFLDDAQFTKDSYINRTRIKTPTGPQWLTVPVLTKGRTGQAIAQVEPNAGVPWQTRHLRAIKLSYARSSRCGFFLPELEHFYAQNWTGLVDLNVELIRWVCNVLRIKTPLVLASQLGSEGTRTERLVSLCKKVNATVYLSGSGGRNYQDEETFSSAGVEVRYSTFMHPRYPQLWGEFVEGLSILDLLLNCGPQSPEILQSASATAGLG